MYTGKMPGRIKPLTGLLFVVLILQVMLPALRGSVPALSAFHPVLALADFALGMALARQATAVFRSGVPLASAQLQPDGVPGD
jgi:hypothetical protein